jgi:hypothetical protein
LFYLSVHGVHLKCAVLAAFCGFGTVPADVSPIFRANRVCGECGFVCWSERNSPVRRDERKPPLKKAVERRYFWSDRRRTKNSAAETAMNGSEVDSNRHATFFFIKCGVTIADPLE